MNFKIINIENTMDGIKFVSETNMQNMEMVKKYADSIINITHKYYYSRKL